MEIKNILKLLQTFTYNWWESFKYINYGFPQRGMMQIKIHCRKCKDESLLKTQKVLNLAQAKEIILSIHEVLARHQSHTEFLTITIVEKDEGGETQYIYDALSNRMNKNVHK